MLHYSEEDSNIYTAIALIANDAEDTVNLLLAWTESICVVSEPYTVVTKIDSTEDWNDLLYSQNHSEKYLSLIAAFLNGDTKTFSSLTLVDEGDYRDFAFPNISRYSIMMDVYSDHSLELLFAFESEDDTGIFSRGIHTYRVENGVPGFYFEKIDGEDEKTDACKYLEKLFERYSWNLDEEKMKENNLSDYHTYYDIVSESWEGDCVSLTAQFYHDASCFLPSHLVQYKLSDSDGEFLFVECEILSESELVPLVWTV